MLSRRLNGGRADQYRQQSTEGVNHCKMHVASSKMLLLNGNGIWDEVHRSVGGSVVTMCLPWKARCAGLLGHFARETRLRHPSTPGIPPIKPFSIARDLLPLAQNIYRMRYDVPYPSARRRCAPQNHIPPPPESPRLGIPPPRCFPAAPVSSIKPVFADSVSVAYSPRSNLLGIGLPVCETLAML